MKGSYFKGFKLQCGLNSHNQKGIGLPQRTKADNLIARQDYFLVKIGQMLIKTRKFLNCRKNF
ncbi:MAG: hypothetical protein COW89_04525 [Nitrospinae bacterium CG22_combo_CG10-13_8_21_14_all_47_10]|nr:MAG: hypothetical protein COW89_04525 [Nitrospinae bacterium CG22_combo_CG10-13_8_21_14_all_47_10]